MEPMTEELKETIIREHPNGIWLVLAKEYPPDVVTAYDLLCGKYRARVIPFPQPTSKGNLTKVPRVDDWIAGSDFSRTSSGNRYVSSLTRQSGLAKAATAALCGANGRR